MADDDADDTSSPSSQPFFVRGGFPFVFLPSTLTGGFNFTNHHTHVSSVHDQSTTESKTTKENGENNGEDEEEEQDDEERTETIGDDEGDRKDENDEGVDEKSNVRISQPKYSQLLKELDFSGARMVDVTDLLSDELDEQENQSIQDENENDNQKRITDDEKYQSLSSARSSISGDEASNPRTFNNNNDHDTDDAKSKDEDNLTDAANEIQNDLNNLATIINETSTDKNDENQSEEQEETNEHEKNDLQKRPTFDEEDDTSKQATQDYDLHENEQENIASSTKSNQNHHMAKQETFDLQDENRSLVSQSGTNTNNHTERQHQTTEGDEEQNEKKEQQQYQPFDWDSIIFGDEPGVQLTRETKPSDPSAESHSTPKKLQQQQPLLSSDEKPKKRTSSFGKQKVVPRPRRTIPSSSSSSDTDSIVEHVLHRGKEKPSSSSLPKHQIPTIIPSQTLRQDSQATLIDENLDELSSQLRQVLHDQERHTYNINTREERTTDRIGSTTFPFSTPDVRSTTIVEDDIPDRFSDNLLRHVSNQRTNYNQQRNRHSSYVPEQSNSYRKKSHHNHQSKYATSRHTEGPEETSTRNGDDDWLAMLEKLEREHKTRIEQQKKQYEDYMHNLEDKMKRRFDDYLTLNNGSQESKSDDYDNTAHGTYHTTHTSVRMDSNIGKHKSHSYHHTYRPVATDLVSHYYPADSTLNVHTSEKKRSTMTDTIPPTQSKEDIMNTRTQLSGRPTRHVDDVKSRYEYEINDLRSQLNRTRLGQTSGTARQSIATIERMNNENVRLRDDVNGLRHSLKVSEDENAALKRQLDELREQINHKDLDLKNYHRTIADLERQLNEAENRKERQNEKIRHVDRQASLYREENEKLKIDLNRTRERLLRLEERSREQENENETLRRQIFLLENDSSRMKNRMTDDHKLSAAMPLNISSPRDYQRLAGVTRHSSSTISTPRDGLIDSARFPSNDTGVPYHSTHSPRPVTRINDYFNEKPITSQSYVSPPRHVYSPKKSSPSRRRTESIPRRSSFDRQTKQTEQLEQKFDQLLKKKRDLEIRLNRIPPRGLTSTDQQLSDVLEREIERVEQQIFNVKLDLRKSNTLRMH